jgi:hypothetical protein
MNNKFKIEKSVYMMMGFIASIGIIFILIRSDLLLNYHVLNGNEDMKPLVQNAESVKLNYKLPSFLILDGEDQPNLSDVIEEHLKQMGKQTEKRNISENFTTSRKYEGIIIATENLDLLPEIQPLLTYVETGGSIFFATRPSPGPGLSAIYQQLGMVEVGSFVETRGIELTKPFFQSSELLTFESENIRNSSLSVRIAEHAILYAKSVNGTPLFWETKYGDGRFVFFNGTMLSDKMQTGLISKGIQLMVPTFIYPVINAKITALEGFPTVYQEGNHRSEGMTNESYLRNVIWAELQRLEAKYDLNFTSSLTISSGNDTIEYQPSELLKIQENIVVYGRELLRMGGEIGVQGSSQIPAENLKLSELKPLLQSTVGLIESALPGFEITSYIPVDQNHPLFHLETMKDYFPTIQTILADVKQPFMTEHNIAVLPKHIKSFSADSYFIWLAYNGLLSSGFVSQAVQPHSILYDPDMETQLQEFASVQSFFQEEVPWIRNRTLSNTLNDVINFEQTVVYEEKTEKGITFHLNQVHVPAYFYFSSDQPVQTSKNCKVIKIGPNLYLIETNELTFSIELEG